MTRKEVAVLLIPPVVTFVVTLIGIRIYSPTGDIFNPTLGLLSGYVIWTITGVSIVFCLPRLLSVHYWLRRRFKDSIETGEKASLSRMLVIILLNLAYWVLIYFLPLSNVVAVMPFAGILEGTLPLRTPFDLMNQSPFWVFFILLVGTGGPATIYLIRLLSEDREKGNSIRALAILQVVCYLSWFLLLIKLVGLMLDYGQLEKFLIFFTFFAFLIFPSAFVSNAAIRFLEIRRKS